MKTKLTLDQLRTEDFFDKDAHNWQYYAYETRNNFGFEEGAIEINKCNIYGVGAVGSFSSSGSSNFY